MDICIILPCSSKVFIRNEKSWGKPFWSEIHTEGQFKLGRTSFIGHSRLKKGHDNKNKYTRHQNITYKKHFSWEKHKYSIVSIAGKIVLICLLVAHQMQPSQGSASALCLVGHGKIK